MSGLKALEKMRKLKKEVVDYRWGVDFDRAVDELEAEIVERFMELPVDDDGAPLKVGKTVYGKYIKGNPEYTVRGFSFDQEHGQWNVQVGDAMWVSQNLLGVKPRTVEDVLFEFWREFGREVEWKQLEGRVSEYAAELRELLGVDA